MSSSVPNKQDFLMKSLTAFFQEPEHIYKMLPIIHGNSQISLRIIDWFVTNYAKKYNTRLCLKYEIENAKEFLVFLNYKSQLKAYTKKQFDPFCRRERINFYYDQQDSSKFIETTVGQLNFFRWSIKHHVLDHISNNIDHIEADMNSSIRKIYPKKELSGKRRRRHELSKSATTTINRHKINITIRFE